MSTILLLNPNTSERSLRMMLGVAAPLLPSGVALEGLCAADGVAMIVNEQDLLASSGEVLRMGVAGAPNASAIIVAAFGDPGVAALRDLVGVPVVGIGEASVMEAAAGGRRFGIATTTPALVSAISAFVGNLGVGGSFAGVRVPAGDPLVLAADAARQEAALARAAADCFDLDGAEAVIIGGGPLSATAQALRERFGNRIIEPVPAAMRFVSRMLRIGPPV